MTHIVDSLRKHQKMIVLGAALAVITLYVIPIDQIATAQSLSERVNQLFSFHINSLSQNSHVPQHVIDTLTDAQYRIVSQTSIKRALKPLFFTYF